MILTRKCPKDSALVALFMNEASPRESAKLLRHLATCSRCSFRFKVLRQIKQDVEPGVGAFVEAHADDPAGAAALLRDAARRESSVLGTGNALSAPIPGRTSPPRSRTFGAFFTLRFAAGLVAVLAVLTAAAYFALTRFQRHAVLRSPSLSLTLLTPLGEISAPPALFRWTPVLNAESYFLEIYDDSLKRVYRGGVFLITEAVLPPPVRSSLAKGRTYVWSISARDGDGILLATKSGSFTIQ